MCFFGSKYSEADNATVALVKYKRYHKSIDYNQERRDLKKRIKRIMSANRDKRAFSTNVVVDLPEQRTIYNEMVTNLREKGYTVHVTERIYRSGGSNVKLLEWFF